MIYNQTIIKIHLLYVMRNLYGTNISLIDLSFLKKTKTPKFGSHISFYKKDLNLC